MLSGDTSIANFDRQDTAVFGTLGSCMRELHIVNYKSGAIFTHALGFQSLSAHVYLQLGLGLGGIESKTSKKKKKLGVSSIATMLCCASFSVLKNAVTCTLGQGETSQPTNFELLCLS